MTMRGDIKDMGGSEKNDSKAFGEVALQRYLP